MDSEKSMTSFKFKKRLPENLLDNFFLLIFQQLVEIIIMQNKCF